MTELVQYREVEIRSKPGSPFPMEVRTVLVPANLPTSRLKAYIKADSYVDPMIKLWLARLPIITHLTEIVLSPSWMIHLPRWSRHNLLTKMAVDVAAQTRTLCDNTDSDTGDVMTIEKAMSLPIPQEEKLRFCRLCFKWGR